MSDDHVTQQDVNEILMERARRAGTIPLHPLQQVAERQLRCRINPQQELNLEWFCNWLAEKSQQPYFKLDPLSIDVPAITNVMSYKFAQSNEILAVAVSATEITIGSSQPFHRDWEQDLAQVIRDKTIRRVLLNPVDLHRYTIEFYNLARSVQGARGQQKDTAGSSVTNFEQLLNLGDLKSADANDHHIVNIVDWLFKYAFNQRSSDIHLEPRRDLGNVRFRIDGVLHDVYELPSAVMAAVVSRIKILGRLNVAEKRRPQDGRLKTKTPDGSEIELRLSTLPTAFGEKLVMRIFDPEVLVRSYQELGLSREDFLKWQGMVKKPNGIVLVTGPTGSGKTTTLYSTLKLLASRDVNVCTIEDPIEMLEPSFNQMQVQAHLELDFSDGLKALLRQDPDIIMLGEIRDAQTAEMAVQAALTGHLVISTLHTNDAPSAVTRLADLGIAPYLIAATLNGVMAQRLVRTLCPHCKAEDKLPDAVWSMLTAPWKAKKPDVVYRPHGCLECRDTGYWGRMGVYEILEMTQEMKEVIVHDPSLDRLRRIAYQQGMRSLRLSGAAKVANGLTTAEEVLRVTPSVVMPGKTVENKNISSPE
ncbi:MAG: GspE/PulE family protein [Pseudomonadota bacterium]